MHRVIFASWLVVTRVFVKQNWRLQATVTLFE